MNLKSPLVIVSAFGRGNTLAQTLQSRDVPVHLLDVSSFLGETKIEDNEGPFGFFSQGLTSIESQRLMMDHPAFIQENGFTLMLPEGPFEFKGSLSAYRLNQLKVPKKIWAWVTGTQLVMGSDHHQILNEDFDDTWLFHLTRSFNSNQWVPNYRAGLVEEGLAFSGDFYVRSVDRNDSIDALKILAQNGVRTSSDVEILDLATSGSNHLKSLEIKTPDSGTSTLVDFEKLVWFLSGEETEKLSAKLQEKLFPKGVLRPVGSWNRARIRLPSASQRDSLPSHSVWVLNRALPWTHENFFVLQRTANEELFDLWFRIPESFRFLQDYVMKLVDSVNASIESRLSLATGSILVAEAPLSTLKSSSELGPSRHPLFESREWLESQAPDFKNFHWIANESLSGLGWNFQVQKSRTVQSNLLDWWKERELQREKAELEAMKIRDRERNRKGVDRD
jgi:hypothetical protein